MTLVDDARLLARRPLLRGMIGLGVLGAVGPLTACTGADTAGGAGPAAATASTATADLSAAVAAADAARVRSGRTVDVTLVARPSEIDLGGLVVPTWTYGDALPGTAIRARQGDLVRVAFRNELPEATSVHWHGLAIRNDMDGVPGVTTPEVPAGRAFAYSFVVPTAGTHWFHPHTGLQLDRGLYAPFIVEADDEPGDYDSEWVLVLDDWTDGVGPSPEQIYAGLTVGSATPNGSASSDGMGGMGGMGGGGMGGGMSGGSMGGMGAGDVLYPHYLVNGRVAADPQVLTGKAGQRVRIRVVNAASDLVFDVALAGHELTVTHTDGFAVAPATTGLLRVGMGERYDVVVTLADGVFPLVAAPVGKTGLARALVRTGAGTAPGPTQRPAELSEQPLTVDSLTAAEGSKLARRSPARTLEVTLAGSMNPYRWTINGRTYEEADPFVVTQGEAVRLRLRNRSMMTHPVHLHGHTFQVGPAGGTGPREDTILLPMMAQVDVDLVADNPGRWMLHCHNTYHAQAGMMARLDYAAA